MGLLEDLGNESNFKAARRSWCSVCLLITTLSDKEAKAFTDRLADKHVANTALSRVLKANGHDISDGTLSRHRRGECQGVA
jgi:hypothetical protein